MVSRYSLTEKNYRARILRKSCFTARREIAKLLDVLHISQREISQSILAERAERSRAKDRGKDRGAHDATYVENVDTRRR